MRFKDFLEKVRVDHNVPKIKSITYDNNEGTRVVNSPIIEKFFEEENPVILYNNLVYEKVNGYRFYIDFLFETSSGVVEYYTLRGSDEDYISGSWSVIKSQYMNLVLNLSRQKDLQYSWDWGNDRNTKKRYSILPPQKDILFRFFGLKWSAFSYTNEMKPGINDKMEDASQYYFNKLIEKIEDFTIQRGVDGKLIINHYNHYRFQPVWREMDLVKFFDIYSESINSKYYDIKFLLNRDLTQRINISNVYLFDNFLPNDILEELGVEKIIATL